MNKYIVSYDLNSPALHYQPLWDYLRSIGAQRVLLSQWVVSYQGTAQQLFSLVWQHMYATDRLMVNGWGNSDGYQINLMWDPNR